MCSCGGGTCSSSPRRRRRRKRPCSPGGRTCSGPLRSNVRTRATNAAINVGGNKTTKSVESQAAVRETPISLESSWMKGAMGITNRRSNCKRLSVNVLSSLELPFSFSCVGGCNSVALFPCCRCICTFGGFSAICTGSCCKVETALAAAAQPALCSRCRTSGAAFPKCSPPGGCLALL